MKRLQRVTFVIEGRKTLGNGAAQLRIATKHNGVQLLKPAAYYYIDLQMPDIGWQVGGRLA